MIDVAGAVHVDDALVDYAVRLVVASREIPQLRLGVSTRGALAIIRASRALAATQGRPYVIVDDLKAVAPAALAHRMLLSPEAELRGASSNELVTELLEAVEAPLPVRSDR